MSQEKATVGGEQEASFNKLKELRSQMKLGGGAKRIESQHSKGKQTARERIDYLLDEGSFQELFGMMQNRHVEYGLDKARDLGDGMVTGFGTINGRRVCVYAQDFTVMGGSFGEVAGKKVAQIMDLAIDAGVPVIGINDGAGARIQEGVYSLYGYGEVFYRNVQASGVIPQISVILGPCAGGAVYSPAITDFIVMAEGTSNMFITGPQVIKAVTHEEVDTETLGGANTHSSISGVAHYVGQNEQETLDIVKTILSYIPDNNTGYAAPVNTGDDPYRVEKSLDTLVPVDPNETYNILDVINAVVDTGSFFEAHARYALNAVVGFARMDGESIGVVANQPAYMAGVLDINASDKIARFVRFCDAFNIPVVTFMDCPGFMPGTMTEHNGIIRHGAKILYAYAEASVPKITVVTRKGYGGAYIVMGSKFLRADMLFAWPNAEIAVMGAGGAVNILHSKEIKDAEDPVKAREGLLADYIDNFSNPYRAAAAGFVDEIILPGETRQRIISSLKLTKNKSVSIPQRKHGNIPL